MNRKVSFKKKKHFPSEIFIFDCAGLEWDNVFVPSFDPRLLSGPANTEFVQDEERRLYHSVCSRARNTLLQCKLVKRWKRG